MKTILITGKNGQLGSEIKLISKSFSKFKFIFTDIDDLDISDEIQVSSYFEKNNFDFLINCAAYTDVERSEIETDKANAVNNLAVGYLIKYCSENNIKMIHISTDYVFDGMKKDFYNENDITKPISVYGKTKLQGELNILKSEHPSIIIRTSWLYSRYEKNFPLKINELSKTKSTISVVNDQFGSPTNAEDLAKACLDLIIQHSKWSNSPQIYHYSNGGFCSWYDFACKIKSIKNFKSKIIPISASNLKLKAKRPSFSAMSSKKINKDFDIKTINWETSLENFYKNKL